MPAASTTTRATRTTRSRPALSRERILDAALEIIDSEGDAALTFRRLGRQLGADPTAVYRYFRSKDDLLLALADAVIVGGVSAVPSDADWRTTLRTLALDGYRVALRHPRLAVLIASRTTQGEAEAQVIEQILAALNRAGFDPEEAVTVWRVFADTVLAWAGLSAAFLSLPPELREKDQAAWTATYPSLSADRFPHLHEAAPYLAGVDTKDPFSITVEILLDGIAARLPTPPRKDPA